MLTEEEGIEKSVDILIQHEISESVDDRSLVKDTIPDSHPKIQEAIERMATNFSITSAMATNHSVWFFIGYEICLIIFFCQRHRTWITNNAQTC